MGAHWTTHSLADISTGRAEALVSINLHSGSSRADPPAISCPFPGSSALKCCPPCSFHLGPWLLFPGPKLSSHHAQLIPDLALTPLKALCPQGTHLTELTLPLLPPPPTPGSQVTAPLFPLLSIYHRLLQDCGLVLLL